MTRFEELLDEFTAAIEAGDGLQLASLFTEDGVYNDNFYGAFAGRDAIAEMLEEHFWGHARDFIWEMKEPISDEHAGYARYVFSYTSTLDGSAGRRIVFEGFCHFKLEDGLIREYSETFDTGIALAQLGFAAERVSRFLGKAADRLRAKHAASPHLGE